jgi:hypothetical protein
VQRLAADENFSGRIVRGLRRRVPGLDLVRVQDSGLQGAGDAAVLVWAAREGRVVLSHDVRTLAAHAIERVRAGEPMAGVVEVGRRVPIGPAIEDLALLVAASLEGELDGRVLFLPLR